MDAGGRRRREQAVEDAHSRPDLPAPRGNSDLSRVYLEKCSFYSARPRFPALHQAKIIENCPEKTKPDSLLNVQSRHLGAASSRAIRPPHLGPIASLGPAFREAIPDC